MISNSKLRNVYGLPTTLGLLLAGLLALAMWFSISYDSTTERLILILMLVIFVIHLLEASYPFRMIEIRALIQDPPFSFEETQLNFEIANTSTVGTEPFFVKLRNDKLWISIDRLEAQSSRIVSLNFTFQTPGIQTVPSIQIKTYTESGLHCFWRNIDLRTAIPVLPRPIDHGIQTNPEEVNSDNEELNSLQEIHDPSRFKFTDPKLFQKTNRRYQRVFHSKQASTQIAYNWDELEKLSMKEKEEQFSFWLRSMAKIKGTGNIEITVQSPFITLNSKGYALNVPSIKRSFAKWLYGHV